MITDNAAVEVLNFHYKVLYYYRVSSETLMQKLRLYLGFNQKTQTKQDDKSVNTTVTVQNYKISACLSAMFFVRCVAIISQENLHVRTIKPRKNIENIQLKTVSIMLR